MLTGVTRVFMGWIYTTVYTNPAQYLTTAVMGSTYSALFRSRTKSYNRSYGIYILCTLQILENLITAVMGFIDTVQYADPVQNLETGVVGYRGM